MANRKVLMLEFNEINWNVVDKLIAQRGERFLPNFTKLRKEGAWATQSAIEVPPHLDPWITWVTVHTGVSREVHGASVLEQNSDTIRAKRLWDYVSAAGRKVGIFGSISAYPPKPVKGFMVPGPFAPGNDTYPPQLQPVQALNRLYTQVHNKTTKAQGPLDMAKVALNLFFNYGLTVGTLARIAGQLVGERLKPASRWKRVCLQPRLNFDFFSNLYKKERPDFATWHSNHAAHFMHHYWRAWDDSGFKAKSNAQERANYGEAVPYGYQLCDELIGRFMQLLDRDTVLVLASSMGQQPFVSERYKDGKIVVRFKSIDRIVELLGKQGIVEVVPTMVPQWNLKIPDHQRRAEAKSALESSYRLVQGQREAAIAVEETEGMLTITPLGLSVETDDVKYFFPACSQARSEGYGIHELFAVDTPTVKQGMHHPDGILAFYGADIGKGVDLGRCTNLDVAPTILSMMGIEHPSDLRGRVLSEAWGQQSQAAEPLRHLAAG